MRTIIWASLAIAVLLVSACAPPEKPQVLPTGDAAESAAASSSPAATSASQQTEDTLLPPESPPPNAEREFSTDFSRHTVPYREVFPGGPPKDGIPAIDAPRLVPVAEADGWLQPQEPVVQVGATRAPIPCKS